MKVLHVFANWKWTGPAEPALNIAAALRAAGHEVTMAAGDAGEHERHFHGQIVERGVQLLEGMFLDKHLNFLRNRKDIRFLADYLKKSPPDLIHTHTHNDHLIVGRARVRAALSIPIVRTSYEAKGPEPGLRSRYLLRHHTNVLVTACQGARRAALYNYGFMQNRVAMIEPGIDTERFERERKVADKRKEFDIKSDDFLVGIVARVQAKRRFDVFLQALQQAKRKLPQLKVFIVGGGTRIKEVGQDPVREMGLTDTVIFTGIQRGEEYVGLLKAMDMQVFLYPGSDGSCRAVREAMSMGLPVIAARRGMLPEIVEDGRTGLIIEDTAGNLASNIIELANNSEKLKRMSKEAAHAARRRFALRGLAAAYEKVYRETLQVANSSQ